MNKLIWLALLMSTQVYAQQSSPVVDPDKFTICAITINSDDEKKLFQAQAAKYPKKFNPVIELTDMGEDDWFKKSCESGIRCDQLVISGHYAGGFFGEKGSKHLEPKEMEEAGCSKTCEGIMKNPHEVFLFGCNTLATKDADHRTPAQYLQVLLQDGIPLAQAEMIVETRYSAIGDSTKATMQRAFGGEDKNIYGFHSVGPSGKNIKGFLQNYFSKINSADHLEKLQAKRMLGQVSAANKLLADSLKVTAFAQCKEGNQDEKTQKICKLVSNKESDDVKLDLVMELLSQNDFLTYLPSIGHYMKELNKENLTPSQKAQIELIQNNKIIKNQIVGLADKAQGLGMKAEWLTLASNIGFISSEEAASKIKPQILNFLEKPLTVQTLSAICSVAENANFTSAMDIQDKEIKNKSIGQFEIYAYSCLGIKNPETILRMANANLNGDEELKETVFYSVFQNLPDGTKLPAWMKDYISTSSNVDSYLKLKAFEKFYPQDHDVIKIAEKALESNPTASTTVVDALKRLNVVEQQSGLIMKALEKDTWCGNCVSTLAELKNSPKVQTFLSQSLDLDSRFLPNHAREIFKKLNLPTNDPVIKGRVEKYIQKEYKNFLAEDWKQVEASGFVLTPEIIQWKEYLKKSLPDFLPSP